MIFLVPPLQGPLVGCAPLTKATALSGHLQQQRAPPTVANARELPHPLEFPLTLPILYHTLPNHPV